MRAVEPQNFAALGEIMHSPYAKDAKAHENAACNPYIGNCDCTKWPERNCLLPHALAMEQLKIGMHSDQIVNDNGQTMLMKGYSLYGCV